MLVDIFYRHIYFGSLLVGVSPHLPQRTQNLFRQISKCKTWLSDWMASTVSSRRRRAPVCFVWILNAFHIFSMGFGFPAKSKYYRAWRSGDPNLLLGVNECVNVIVCVLAWDRPELSPCVSLSSARCMLVQSVLLKEKKNNARLSAKPFYEHRYNEHIRRHFMKHLKPHIVKCGGQTDRLLIANLF